LEQLRGGLSVKSSDTLSECEEAEALVLITDLVSDRHADFW
jgi:hypothetical protein